MIRRSSRFFFASTSAAAAATRSSQSGLQRPFLGQRPAAQLIRDALEENKNRDNSLVLRWIDITHALPAALATREADTLLTCVCQKLCSEVHDAEEGKKGCSEKDTTTTTTTMTTASVDDLLTLDTACGLFQVCQFADIESRASELFERAAAVESFQRQKNRHHPTSDAVRAQSRGLALFLSGGSIPLSMRQRCSDGTCTAKLLRLLLVHPAFVDKPAEQAILVDAAGKVLERLAASTLGSEVVKAFMVANGSTIRRLYLRAEQEAEELNDRNNNSMDAAAEEDGQQQQQQRSQDPSADPLQIHRAERTMMREAWRRLQRSVRRNGNPAALVATVEAELQYHLKLVAVGTDQQLQQPHHHHHHDFGGDEMQQEEEGTMSSSATPFIATLSGLELTDAELDELSLFDFHCAIDAMHFTSNFLLASLLPSHPLKRSSDGHSGGGGGGGGWESNPMSDSYSLVSLPQLQKVAAMTDRIRVMCPVDSAEWLALRDAVTVAGLLARHSIEVLYGIDMGLRIVFRDLFDNQLEHLTAVEQLSSSSNSSSSTHDDVDNNQQRQQQQQQQQQQNSPLDLDETPEPKAEAILAEQLEEDLLVDDDEEETKAALRRRGGQKEEDKGTSSQQQQQQQQEQERQVYLAGGKDLSVVNKFNECIVDTNMRAVLLVATLHLIFRANGSSMAPMTREEKFQDANRARLLLQSIVKHHFPRGTNLQQLRQSGSSAYAAASSAAMSAAASFSNNTDGGGESGDDAGDFDGNNSNNNDIVAASSSAAINTSTATPPPDYELLQHAHVAVVKGLCNNESSAEEGHENDGSDMAYALLSASKYYGVRVTSPMLLPVLRRLSPRGDSRVFNAIDVCALFSGCPVTDDVLCEALKACAAAGDHHRARVLMQLLRADVPGILMKLPDEALRALAELDVIPKVAKTFFEDDADARGSFLASGDAEAVENEVLPLQQQQQATAQQK